MIGGMRKPEKSRLQKNKKTRKKKCSLNAIQIFKGTDE